MEAGRRYDPRVEAAVYFCCVEALRADGWPISIDLTEHADRLVLRISGAHDGVDLRGVEDRGEATGGHLQIAPGELFLTIPVASTADRESALVDHSLSLLPGG